MRLHAATAMILFAMTTPPAAAGTDPMAMDMHPHAFAAGRPGDPAKPARLVPVTMRETGDGKMLFVPDRLNVTAGEQVRFAITNAGTTDHEFMLDTPAHNAAHEATMAAHPGMTHRDPNGTTVAPGKSADLVWAFTKPGTFEYACLIPGHYEAGMHAVVTVR